MQLVVAAVVLAFLCAVVAAECDILQGTQKVSYRSEFKASDAQALSKTKAEALITCLGSYNGLNYFKLRLNDLEIDGVAASADIPASFETIFARDAFGVVAGIQAQDFGVSSNVVGSIVELLSTSNKDKIVVEQGAAGVRRVEYHHLTKTHVRGLFSTSSFQEFAPGSNLQSVAKRMVLKGTKDIFVNTNNAVELVQSVVSLARPEHDVTIISSLLFNDGALKYGLASTVLQSAPAPLTSLVRQIKQGSKSVDAGEAIQRLRSALSQQNKNVMYKELSAIASELGRDNLAADEFAAQVAQLIKSNALPANKHVYTVVASLRSTNAADLFASQLSSAIAANDEHHIQVILTALHFGKITAAPVIALLGRISTSSVLPRRLRDMASLALGSLAKLIEDDEQKNSILAPFVKMVTAENENDAVLAIHVLGNAAAVEALITNLRSGSLSPVRVLASVRALRDFWEEQGVVDTIKHVIKQEGPAEIMNMLRDEVAATIQRYAERGVDFSDYSDLVAQVQKLEEPKIAAESNIWNDTSSSLYNLISPWRDRNNDVALFPRYSAYLLGEEFGRPKANFRLATGLFSGNGASGCLTGNFKVFDKVYIDSTFSDDFQIVLDAFLYSVSYNNVFDSRLYVYVSGNVVLDIELDLDCNEREIALFDADIALLDEEATFPFDGGEALLIGRIIFGLKLGTSWRICLVRTLEPYIGIELTVDFDVDIEFLVRLELLGRRRTGVEIASYFQYEIGPATSLGSQNDTNGRVVCAACIGIFAGNDAGYFYLDYFSQDKQGLSWGPKEVRELFHYDLSAHPFLPLVETCAISYPAPAAAVVGKTSSFIPRRGGVHVPKKE